MSWVLRFVKPLKKEKPECVVGRTLTLVELQRASEVITRLVQRQHFREEYMALKEGRQVKCSSSLATLSPILTDGIIRVGGRIHRAPITFEAAHPVILPKSSPVSVLIVRYYHHVLGHAGREHVLSVLRQRYWILRGRALVRQILSKCISCRKRNMPALQQAMADLPKERLLPYHPPFTFTGLDFFGPFYVKRARSVIKVYGCIFVCFNSRAVHIEDVSSLETDTFILAYCISRTGLDWTGLDWTSKTRTSKTRTGKTRTSKTRTSKTRTGKTRTSKTRAGKTQKKNVGLINTIIYYSKNFSSENKRYHNS